MSFLCKVILKKEESNGLKICKVTGDSGAHL